MHRLITRRQSLGREQRADQLVAEVKVRQRPHHLPEKVVFLVVRPPELQQLFFADVAVKVVLDGPHKRVVRSPFLLGNRREEAIDMPSRTMLLCEKSQKLIADVGEGVPFGFLQIFVAPPAASFYIPR